MPLRLLNFVGRPRAAGGLASIFCGPSTAPPAVKRVERLRFLRPHHGFIFYFRSLQPGLNENGFNASHKIKVPAQGGSSEKRDRSDKPMRRIPVASEIRALSGIYSALTKLLPQEGGLRPGPTPILPAGPRGRGRTLPSLRPGPTDRPAGRPRRGPPPTSPPQLYLPGSPSRTPLPAAAPAPPPPPGPSLAAPHRSLGAGTAPAARPPPPPGPAPGPHPLRSAPPAARCRGAGAAVAAAAGSGAELGAGSGGRLTQSQGRGSSRQPARRRSRARRIGTSRFRRGRLRQQPPPPRVASPPFALPSPLSSPSPPLRSDVPASLLRCRRPPPPRLPRHQLWGAAGGGARTRSCGQPGWKVAARRKVVGGGAGAEHSPARPSPAGPVQPPPDRVLGPAPRPAPAGSERGVPAAAAGKRPPRSRCGRRRGVGGGERAEGVCVGGCFTQRRRA